MYLTSQSFNSSLLRRSHGIWLFFSFSTSCLLCSFFFCFLFSYISWHCFFPHHKFFLLSKNWSFPMLIFFLLENSKLTLARRTRQQIRSNIFMKFLFRDRFLSIKQNQSKTKRFLKNFWTARCCWKVSNIFIDIRYDTVVVYTVNSCCISIIQKKKHSERILADLANYLLTFPNQQFYVFMVTSTLAFTSKAFIVI